MPVTDTPTTFGCWGGYEYEACRGVRPQLAVPLQPCTLDGADCAALPATHSFCIDSYPAEQCRRLCDATGGRGGSSGASYAALLRCDSLPLTVLRLGAGITATTLVNSSCAAYHTTDSGENRSRCCLYTQADINDPTRGRLTQDPSGTLHVQVGLTML